MTMISKMDDLEREVRRPPWTHRSLIPCTRILLQSRSNEGNIACICYS